MVNNNIKVDKTMNNSNIIKKLFKNLAKFNNIKFFAKYKKLIKNLTEFKFLKRYKFFIFTTKLVFI